MNLQRKITKVINHFGLNIVWANNSLRMWHPTSLTIHREDPSEALHELAHYLCAAPERRRRVNFGCGDDYEYLQTNQERIISQEDAQEEESRASFLGILMERELGMDWKATCWEHNWLGAQDYRLGLTSIKQAGLMKHVDQVRRMARRWKS